jgi:hypothetical protein
MAACGRAAWGSGIVNRRIFVTFLGLSLFTTGIPKVASAQPRPMPERLRNPKLRRGIAEDYRKSFLALDKQIPTLSPDEERWLRTEIDDTEREAGGVYTKRALDAMESKAWSFRVTKPHVRMILDVLDEIIAYPAPGQRGEVRLWGELAVLFMDLTFWQEVDKLVGLGVIEKKINGVEQFYFQNHVLWAKVILSDVVIPSL